MVQPSLTGLDYQTLLSCYGFHQEHGLRNSSNVFLTVIKVLIVFKMFAPCLKNEAVNQLKANFIYWKATFVSQDYTHLFAVCAHFERHLPPSLRIMVLKSVQSTLSHLITTSVPRARFTRFLFIVNRFKVHSLSSGKGEMFLCAACHAFTPHVNEWKNWIGIVVQVHARE